MSVFCFSTRAEFQAEGDAIANRIRRQGYALLHAWDDEPATLREVAERFGHVQSHIRADAKGLVGIGIETVVNRDWEQHRSEYHGTSSGEFYPHTDGSYLNGLVRQGDRYLRLFPPKMLALQCWQTAGEGGGNILVDGERVLHDLAARAPDMLRLLSTKGCVTFCRDDQIAPDCAVFEPLDDGFYMLRFRYDDTVYLADWAFDAFHTLQRDYFSRAEYQTRVMLAKGDILLIDNYRVLHGREAFAAGADGQQRSLRRVWLARDTLPALRNAMDEHKERRALQRFGSYNVLPAAAGFAATAVLPVGIRRAA